MDATPQELTIETPGMRLAAKGWGPSDGVPTLALHGWLDNAASFDGVAPRLSGHRVVALDLPGHGHSDHVGAGHDYPFIDYPVRVLAAADALGWDDFCLVGHSLGAAVATVLAGAVPGRVRRLALIEGLGPVVEPPERAPGRLAEAMEAAKRRAGGGRRPVYPTVDAAVSRLRQSMSQMSESAAQTLCARGLEPTDGGWTWRSDPRLRLVSRLRLSEAQVLAFIAAIDCPTLLVCGSSGFPFAPRRSSERVRALRTYEMVELPGGHHLHLDTPEPVAAAITRFFSADADSPAPPAADSLAP